MKVSVNDEELFAITSLQKQVILNDLNFEKEEDLVAHLSTRIQEILMLEKHDRCLARLIAEWKPILEERGIALPSDYEAAVTLIFSQPDYKNRAQREAEVVATRQKLADKAAAQRAEEATEKQKMLDDAAKAAVAQALAQQSAP